MMLELTVNNKQRIRGEGLMLELIFNNLSGVGFDASHPRWQMEFNEYVDTVSKLLHLKIKQTSQIKLTWVETGELIAESSVGECLNH